MAGKRHHTIPQFLQRGFASNRETDATKVWMYRKGQPGFENAIVNVSVVRDFYGTPAESDLDERITNLENEFAPLVASLRAASVEQSISDPRIPVFLAHCALRTRHIREFVIGMFEDLFIELRQVLNRDEVIYRLMVKELSKPGPSRAGIESALLAIGADPGQLDIAIRKIQRNLPEVINTIDPSIVTGVKGEIEKYIVAAKSIIPGTVRNGFIEGMSRNFDHSCRAEQFSRFHWHVIRVGQPLILGDTISLFETAGNRRFKPLADGADDVRRIYIPLASDRLLVGSTSESAPLIDVLALNIAISRCSFEFFVSSGELPEESELAKGLGMWSGLLSRKESDRIVRDLARSFIKS